MNARPDARSASLQRLCAPDFAAIVRHGGVVRHVLWLERADLEAAPMKNAGEASDKKGLADIGACACEHDGAHED
jgi:hypothetical protein